MREAWVRSLGWEDPLEKKGFPLQYSGLENSMDHIVHGVTRSWTLLSNIHIELYLQITSSVLSHQWIDFTQRVKIRIGVKNLPNFPLHLDLLVLITIFFWNHFIRVERLLNYITMLLPLSHFLGLQAFFPQSLGKKIVYAIATHLYLGNKWCFGQDIILNVYGYYRAGGEEILDCK